MARPRARHTRDILTETASGHRGKCAFHSFALTLFLEEILTRIDQNLNGEDGNEAFGDFVQAVSEKLNIANDWDTVQAALLNLRHDNKVQFQNYCPDFAISPFNRIRRSYAY